MKRVGVIGGGQLAWMMVPAAKTLGIELQVQTPSLTDPIGTALPPDQIVLAAIANASATALLAEHCDVITFENEFVDHVALEQLAAKGVSFYPQIQSLQPVLDKYHQRQCFQQLDIPTPQFTVVDDAFIVPSQYPVVLKARRHGYDGKGTHIITTATELEIILAAQPKVSWLVEEFVPFERELAVMAARSPSGEIAVYPTVETQQEQQVCRRVLTLPELDTAIQQQVGAIAHKLLNQLEFVGILGIEFFLTSEGQVLVNEIAPRTHNSGHYTIDACATSQFEQQLRAVTGLALGPVHLTCKAAVMVNLLGYEESNDTYETKRAALAALPHTQVYWYGKPVCRPGRKMGHVTAILPNDDRDSDALVIRRELEAIATQIEQIWQGDG